MVLNLVCAFYFLILEMLALWGRGFRAYVTGLANLVNLLPICLSVPLALLYFRDRLSVSGRWFATMSALSSLCLWTRALALLSHFAELG